MAWVHQYYICLNCNFKDKLCSLFLLPFHCSHSYIHTWDWDKCYARCLYVSLLLAPFLCILWTNFPHFISFFCWLLLRSFFHQTLFIHQFRPASPQSVVFSFLPYLFIISYFLPFYLLSISRLSPTPRPSLAVYKASTLSSALWLMLYRSHPSPQCHHSAFKIQSFSETAVVHHLSSPPFWPWLRGTIGVASWRPAWILNSLDTWSILILMSFDRFHWSLGDDSSPILRCGGM